MNNDESETPTHLAARLGISVEQLESAAGSLGIALPPTIHPGVAELLTRHITSQVPAQAPSGRVDYVKRPRHLPVPGTRDNATAGSRSAGAVPGTRDNAAAAGRGGTVPATRDGSGVSGPSGVRIGLPSAWAAEFTPVRVISRGTQADVLEVWRQTDGETLVVKGYRVSGDRFEKTRSLLPRLNHDGIVRVDRLELLDGDWWELQEYVPGGTLAELVGQRLDATRLDVLVQRMVVGLDHLHSLDLVHRDVKPSNILLHSTTPFVPVLGDLGLARFMDASQDYGSASGTPPYAPPENAFNKVTRKFDWWSLGMVVLELASGQHPLRATNGEWFSPGQMADLLLHQVIEIPTTIPARYQSLCAGLLTVDINDRWGSEQLHTWLNGGSPAVRREAVAATSGSNAARVVHTINIDGREYRSLDQIAVALAGDSRLGRRIIGGRASSAPDFARLRIFFAEIGRDDLRSVLDVVDNSEGGLAELLARMSPKLPPTFAGRDISEKGLRALIAEAAKTPATRNIIVDLQQSGALSAFSSAQRPGGAGLATLDANWRESIERFKAVRHGNDSGELTDATVALLRAELDPSYRDELRRKAAVAANDPDARETPWFTQMATTTTSDNNTADHLAVTMAMDTAKSEAVDKRAADHAADEAARRQRAERQRDLAAASRSSRQPRIGRWGLRGSVVSVSAIGCGIWYTAIQFAHNAAGDPVRPVFDLAQAHPWFHGFFLHFIGSYWFFPFGNYYNWNLLTGSRIKQIIVLAVVGVLALTSHFSSLNLRRGQGRSPVILEWLVPVSVLASLALLVMVLPVLLVALLYSLYAVAVIAVIATILFVITLG